MTGLNSHRALSYQKEIFAKDCARRKLTDWQEQKKYAQSDKLWSKLIEWHPWPGKKPGDLDYCERPFFVVTKNKTKEKS